MLAVITVRRFASADAPTLWALNDLPNIGATADPTVPLPLPPATNPPASFPDLADITGCFLRAGGDFLVAEQNGHVVGMGGIRPSGQGRAEVLRVRVHPATRRRGVGRVRKDPDGSYDVLGTKSGAEVFYDVSADLKTFTLNTHGGGR